MMRLKPMLVALFCLAGGAVHAGDWQFIKNEDGIRVFKREVEGSPVLAFRGDGEVDAPIAKVATILFDTTRATEWIEDEKESHIVRWIAPDEFIEYDHVGTPFITKDRDFVSRVKFTVTPADRAVRFVYAKAEDPNAPPTSYVRGDLMNTTFVVTALDPGRCRVEAEIHVDPKGSVPKWIVNFFQESWPIDTFKSLRKQAAKRDVASDARFEPGEAAAPVGGADSVK